MEAALFGYLKKSELFLKYLAFTNLSKYCSVVLEIIIIALQEKLR